MANDKEQITIAEAADAVAGTVVVFGDRVASDLLAHMPGDVRVSPGGQAQIRLHLIMLCYFWTDRTAFETLGIARRDTLMDVARIAFAETLASLDQAAADTASFRETLDTMIDAAVSRWAEYPITPKMGSNPKGTLFWEFGKEIAELAGSPLHAEVVTTSMIMASQCVKAFDPSVILKRIAWPSDN